MTDSTVAVDLNHSLDVECNITTEVTLNYIGCFDNVTELCYVALGQVFCADIRIDSCLSKNVLCALKSDTVNISESYLNSLIVRNINTGYTSHIVISPFPLVFVVFRFVYAQPCLCLCLGFSHITITLPFLLMILHFSQIFFTEGLTFISVIFLSSYFIRQVMRPLLRSYTDTSTVTRSPGKIRI